MLSSGYDVDGIGARRDWMQKLDRWQNELSSFTGQIRYRLREREYAALNMA